MKSLLRLKNIIKAKIFEDNISSNDSNEYKALPKEIIQHYNITRPYGPQPVLCYAPFKNMYFGISGFVRACCRSETNCLGSFPQQTIKEIWLGKGTQKMKEYIKNNDLSQGCIECHQHLTGGNFSAVVAKMFDYQKLNDKFPSIMEFELDNTCNLECVICAGRLSSSIRKNRDKLPETMSPYNESFVKQLEEFIPHLEEARFYGGEPFLINIYYDIWELILKINPNVKIYIQTNGTVLNDRIKKMMDKGMFIINISIDALKKPLFEKLRLHADFDMVMNNLMYFHNYSLKKKTFFCITPTIMRENWQELPDLINFCNKLNIPLFYNTLYRPEHLALYTLKGKELQVIYDELKTHEFRNQNSTQKQNNYFYKDFVNLVATWKYKAAERESGKNPTVLFSKDEARKKLIENLKFYIEDDASIEFEKKNEAFSKTVIQLDRILYLFKDEDESEMLYNNLIQIPVQVVIEEIRTLEAIDDDNLINMLDVIKNRFFNLLYSLKVNNNEGKTNTSIKQEFIKEYNQTRIYGPKPYLCYAPFENLFFGTNGKITACCKSLELSENYPSKSLKEIWTGSSLNMLRENIMKNDLSYASYECKTSMESKNFLGVQARFYDSLTHSTKILYPKSLEFETNNNCNLECIMCYGQFSSAIMRNRDKMEDYISPYDIDFQNQLEEFIPHIKEAKFYGGEPFLIKEYYDIWDKIIKINPKATILVQTNGTIINDKIKRLLENGRFSINISIDSINKETYESIRKNADFKDVMDNLKYFHEYSKKKGTYFGIIACPMKQNWKEIPELINFCNRLDTPVFFNTVIHPPHCTLMNLPSTELRNIYDLLSEHTFSVKTQAQKQNRMHYFDFLNQIRKWKEHAEEKEKIKIYPLDESLNIFLNNKEIKIYPLDEALNIFLNNISTYIENDINLKNIDKISFIDKISSKLDLLSKKINDKQKLTTLYNKLLQYHVYVVVYDLLENENISDEDLFLKVTDFIEN